MDNSPIGVFDSGMGGLSVWRELRRALPGESLLYYGDGTNCPYGEKPAKEVVGYIRTGVDKLISEGAKLVVLACNTATVTAIRELREEYDIPFVGMEPAVKPAAESTRSGVVGVLATHGTRESEWFAGLKGKYSAGTKVITAVGDGFVRIVEGGMEDTEEATEAVRRALAPMIDAGVDRIVLGCTHYPFLAGKMREVIGSRNIEIIDPAPAIVRRVEWLLEEAGLAAPAGNKPEYKFFSASGPDYIDRLRLRAFAE